MRADRYRSDAPNRSWLWLVALIGLSAGCAAPDPAHLTPYNESLNSPGTKFSGLPPAVQNTVRAQAGAAEIDDIERVTVSEPAVYRIDFRNPVSFPSLLVQSDGSVLNPNWTIAVGAGEDSIGIETGGATSGVKVADLPAKVVQTIREKAPTLEVANINRITIGTNIYYEIFFKDQPNSPPMLIAGDGVLMRTANP